MQLLTMTPRATDPLLPMWLASQPRHHVLVRCRPGGFERIAADVMSIAAAPVRFCRLPGPLRLPHDHIGTLVLNDVASLALADQIAVYDWLAFGTGKLRVISVTAAPLEALVAQGAFLECLFHRLSAVQFDLTTGELLS